MSDVLLGSPGGTPYARYVAIYCLVAGVVCFAWLGSTDVVSMEGIVADGARHMGRTGHYAVPHLYGQIYAYKPPLTCWLVRASFDLFDRETEWTLRFPIALTGFLMGAGVLTILASRLGPRTACLCALASLTGAIVIQKARIAEFDMPLAAGVGIAVVAACANLSARRASVLLWMIGYAGLAFGFLVKGMPAVMAFVPGLLVAAVTARRLRRLAAPAHLIGTLCCVVPVGLWLACAWQAHGMQAFEQPLSEARSRSLDWGWKALGLTFAKPAIVATLFIPWTVLLPVVFSKSWRQTLGESSRRLVGAAMSFLLVGTLAFMIVPTNSSRYYVPLCVPLGILAGIGATAKLTPFGRLCKGRHLAGLVCLAIVTVMLVVVCAGIAPARVQTFPRALLAVLACLTAGIFVHAARRIDDRFPARMFILCALSIWALDAWVVRPYRAESRSLRQVALALDAHLPDDAAVWTEAGDSHSSLFFYLARPVRSFSLRTGEVPPGAFVVLPASQLSILEARDDFEYSVIERAASENRVYLLAKVP